MKERLAELESQESTVELYELQKERNKLEAEILDLRSCLRSESWEGFIEHETDVEELEAEITQYANRLAD